MRGAADTDPGADRHRNRGGSPHQQQRGKDVPANHRQHRRTIAEGVAPVAVEKPPGPVEILHPKRPIEPQLLFKAIEIVLRHAGIEPELRQWPPRHQVQDDEADERDDQEQDEAL